MKIGILYYDGFCEFELVLACLLLHGHELVSLAAEMREYRSEEGQRFLVDATTADTDPASLDALIIPGGDSVPLYGHDGLRAFVSAVIAGGKLVAAICGGSELLAAFGLLDGRRCTGDTTGIGPDSPSFGHYAKATTEDAYVVADGNVITAQGQAFAEFAVETAFVLGTVRSREEADANLRWLKNIR